jgi:hypothetical protein
VVVDDDRVGVVDLQARPQAEVVGEMELGPAASQTEDEVEDARDSAGYLGHGVESAIVRTTSSAVARSGS